MSISIAPLIREEEKVAQAIRRETDRGGQVFYLHNRVESLEETRLKLQRIVPEMMIETAHGQMSSEELDDIFRRFKLGGFQVLIATTIISAGIIWQSDIFRFIECHGVGIEPGNENVSTSN